MLKIGITLNIKKYFKNYIDYSDHYWLKAFEKKNIELYFIPNNIKISEKIFNKINILILSGGNDVSSKDEASKIRDKIEYNLINKSLKKKIPIIGICRGAQILNIYFGGEISKVKNHMNTRHDIYFDNVSFFKKKKIEVNSYHNFGIPMNTLSRKLSLIAKDRENNVEIFYCSKKRILGTMWHPEREKNLRYLFKLINFIKK